MTTATVDQTRPAPPATGYRRDDLRQAHLAAAALVADLDLGDRRLWRRVDRTVAELTAAAYRLTAAVTGGRPEPAPRNLPPVVRVRTLAAGQQRLFAALDRYPAPDPALLGPAVREVRTAIDQLSASNRPR